MRLREKLKYLVGYVFGFVSAVQIPTMVITYVIKPQPHWVLLEVVFAVTLVGGLNLAVHCLAKLHGDKGILDR